MPVLELGACISLAVRLAHHAADHDWWSAAEVLAQDAGKLALRTATSIGNFGGKVTELRMDHRSECQDFLSRCENVLEAAGDATARYKDRPQDAASIFNPVLWDLDLIHKKLMKPASALSYYAARLFRELAALCSDLSELNIRVLALQGLPDMIPAAQARWAEARERVAESARLYADVAVRMQVDSDYTSPACRMTVRYMDDAGQPVSRELYAREGVSELPPYARDITVSFSSFAHQPLSNREVEASGLGWRRYSDTWRSEPLVFGPYQHTSGVVEDLGGLTTRDSSTLVVQLNGPISSGAYEVHLESRSDVRAYVSRLLERADGKEVESRRVALEMSHDLGSAALVQMSVEYELGEQRVTSSSAYGPAAACSLPANARGIAFWFAAKGVTGPLELEGTGVDLARRGLRRFGGPWTGAPNRFGPYATPADIIEDLGGITTRGTSKVLIQLTGFHRSCYVREICLEALLDIHAYTCDLLARCAARDVDASGEALGGKGAASAHLACLARDGGGCGRRSARLA